ncbi:MAG: hypothetical protein JST82_05500 [Bacteroidetes bacterium]|nr:hypothetical protein [Bacteroidota bacterium]
MGSKNIKNIIGIILCAALFQACVKDKPADPIATPEPVVTENVYVVCEGNFGNGDGSLYRYDPKLNTVYGDIYASVTGGKLGDVFQSMTRIGDKLFLCVNNSDKIVVLNRADNSLAGTINIPKPRYIIAINEEKAYVSTLFSNKVYIINPKSLVINGTIDMPYQNPEGMVMHNGKVYACTWDTACKNIYTIDIVTDKVAKAIPIQGAAPQEVLVDNNNQLWVLSGNVSKGKNAVLTVLNQQEQVVKSYSFPPKADVIRPAFNKTKDVLYFIEVNYAGGTDYNGIFKMSVNDAGLPNKAFVAAQSFQYFWALGVSPITDKVYIGDPKGFTQKGSVSVYNTDGSLNTQFAVGVGPGHFLFD